MTAVNLGNTLHLLAVLVWVGGMFFAHMALRPAVEAQLEPAVRLPLLNAVLRRFFRWVWLAVALILGSGYWLFLGVMGGRAALYVHVMQGLGLVMTLLFLIVYFLPYRRMTRALEAGNMAEAGAQMALVRRIIATNLVLGLITTVVGGGKFF